MINDYTTLKDVDKDIYFSYFQCATLNRVIGTNRTNLSGVGELQYPKGKLPRCILYAVETARQFGCCLRSMGYRNSLLPAVLRFDLSNVLFCHTVMLMFFQTNGGIGLCVLES